MSEYAHWILKYKIPNLRLHLRLRLRGPKFFHLCLWLRAMAKKIIFGRPLYLTLSLPRGGEISPPPTRIESYSFQDVSFFPTFDDFSSWYLWQILVKLDFWFIIKNLQKSEIKYFYSASFWAKKWKKIRIYDILIK